MQRVAVIADVLHPSGKHSLVMGYYRHINRTKVQFDFICGSNPNGIPEEEVRSLGGQVYKVAPYKDVTPHLKEAYKILKEDQYEVMHTFDNTLNLFPMFSGCIAGVKMRISESISEEDKDKKRTLIRYILRTFSHWFTSCYMANSIDCSIWQFGRETYDRGKVNTSKTVIDANANSFNAKLREDTRKGFGWENRMVYGFVDRYVSQKNPFFLINIFNEIAKEQENAILTMTGFGELAGEMHDRTERYEVTDRAVDLGCGDDIKQSYNAFDAFLLPSLYEGMPVVGTEVQCARLPIFSPKNITEEAAVSELAYYVGLEESPNIWADKVIKGVNGHVHKHRNYVSEVIKNGFGSSDETLKLQKFCLAKINQVDDMTGKGK